MRPESPSRIWLRSASCRRGHTVLSPETEPHALFALTLRSPRRLFYINRDTAGPFVELTSPGGAAIPPDPDGPTVRGGATVVGEVEAPARWTVAFRQRAIDPRGSRFTMSVPIHLHDLRYHGATMAPKSGFTGDIVTAPILERFVEVLLVEAFRFRSASAAARPSTTKAAPDRQSPSGIRTCVSHRKLA